MTEVLRAVGRRTSILAAGESDAKGCSARAASRVARYPNGPVAKWRPFTFLPTSRRFLLTTKRGRVRTSPSRSLRGVSGEARSRLDRCYKPLEALQKWSESARI